MVDNFEFVFEDDSFNLKLQTHYYQIYTTINLYKKFELEQKVTEEIAEEEIEYDNLYGKLSQKLIKYLNIGEEESDKTDEKICSEATKKIKKIYKGKNMTNPNKQSTIQRLVINYLENCGLDYEIEATIYHISVDILVRKYNLVIEIEGPGHWVYPTEEINLNTSSRNNLLKRLGYTVINIGERNNTMAGIEKLSKQLDLLVNANS